MKNKTIEKQEFKLKGKPVGFTVLDFWKYQYSNMYFQMSEIMEFVVGQALGLEDAQNQDYWTLWDITYRGKRIEVKQTSYYHSWNETKEICKRRSFDIHKSNSSYEDDKGENVYSRQNDIYVFCLSIGMNSVEADPLNLDTWEFYIVPTEVINEKFKNQKSVSIGPIQRLVNPVRYDEIKKNIDCIIDKME